MASLLVTRQNGEESLTWPKKQNKTQWATFNKIGLDKWSGCHQMVENPNPRNKFGLTPIDVATEKGHQEVVDVLMQ